MTRPRQDPDGDDVQVDDNEALAVQMAALGRRATVARSYVRHVLDNGMTVRGWLAKKLRGMPSVETWYKPLSQGGYLWGANGDHDVEFRAACQAYWAELQKTRTREHLRLAARAERTMAMAVPDAAQSLVKLSTKARNEQTKYNAARFLVQQRTRAEVTADADAWDEAEADAAQDDE